MSFFYQMPFEEEPNFGASITSNMKRVYLFTLFTMIMAANTFSQTEKPVFVLVHGAWYGAFAWKKLTPLLEAKGYKVVTLDLPGYGTDNRPVATLTLDDYVKKLVETVRPLKEKLILVGHSMGGAVITQAAEVLGPEKVAKLVFLDAFLLKNGESIFMQVEQINAATKAAGNAAAKKLQTDFLIFSADGKSCTVAKERMAEVFCHDCLPEDQAVIKANPGWQPAAVLAAPMQVTDKRYGSIPKFYIQCTEARDLDRTSILHNVPCVHYYTLPSSHSAFFSMPGKLAALLADVQNYIVPVQ